MKSYPFQPVPGFWSVSSRTRKDHSLPAQSGPNGTGAASSRTPWNFRVGPATHAFRFFRMGRHSSAGAVWIRALSAETFCVVVPGCEVVGSNLGPLVWIQPVNKRIRVATASDFTIWGLRWFWLSSGFYTISPAPCVIESCVQSRRRNVRLLRRQRPHQPALRVAKHQTYGPVLRL